MTYVQTVLRRVREDICRTRTALIIILSYMAITQFLFHTVCPFLILTGRPCPACGLTRAAFCVLSLRFAKAWEMNASIYLWMPFLLYLCVFRYILGRKPPLALPFTVTVCLATYGIYLWRLVH